MSAGWWFASGWILGMASAFALFCFVGWYVLLMKERSERP